MDLASGSAMHINTNTKGHMYLAYIRFTLFVMLPSLLVSVPKEIYPKLRCIYIKKFYFFIFLKGDI